MERNLAVLIDHENIATGCEKEGLGRFDVRIVMRRLKDKGRILVSRAYADWGRWNRFKLDLVHEGVQMVELTSHGMQSKNRADIALAVDAMELAYTRAYVDTFVILSGDSDFTPLVMRLKELNKRVIGCGTRRSTSRLIAETCDEFFFYDTLRDESRIVPAPKVEEEEDEEEELTLDEALELLVETLENHQRDEGTPVHASVLKASMKRKEPTFSEVELGMRTFAQFLETAQQKGLIRLFKDERAGGWRVDSPQAPAEAAPPPPPVTSNLSEEARRVLGRLAESGLEFGDPAERRIVIEQFVATCGERAARNRTCAVQFVLGDLLRRCKAEAPTLTPRTVKAVVHALRRVGALRNASGSPVTSSTAPFVAPTDAAALLHTLHAAGLKLLEERGETPSPEVLAELLGGDLPAPAEETGENDTSENGREPGEGGRKRRRRRRRRGGGEQALEGEHAEGPWEDTEAPPHEPFETEAEEPAPHDLHSALSAPEAPEHAVVEEVLPPPVEAVEPAAEAEPEPEAKARRRRPRKKKTETQENEG